MEDPYLMFVKCFATWLRLRIIMGFMVVWSLILMSLTAWMMQSSGGNFADLSFPSQRSYSNWGPTVCGNLPFKYLSPFEFTWSSTNVTGSSSVSTICPWPTPNSELRISMSVFSIVTLLLLYFKSPLSFFARAIFAIYAFIFFSAFVIDAAACTAGLEFCQSGFKNTMLNQDINALNITLTCTTSNYQLLAAFDLLLSALYFIVYSAWNYTTDLYVVKK